MVRAACVANGQSRRAKVVEGREPCVEDGARHVVALKVDSANLTTAVIEVKITSQLRMLLLRRHLRRIGEVLLHIRLRTEKPLLLPGPQRKAHSAARFQSSGFENANRFHDYGAAGCV